MKHLKRIVCTLLSALMVFSFACADDSGSTPPWVKPEKTADPSDFISVNQTITFTADEYLTVADGELQGGCTDGTYYYVALGDAVDDASTINKYNIATKELTATYGTVKGKFSDLTYNPVTKEIIAAKSGAENTKISVFNAETMKLKSTKTMPVTTYSIAYDHYENCYWVLTSNLGIAKLNANFKKVGTPYEFADSGCALKGIDVDSEFIYVLLYEADKIMVYDKTGAFEREIYLPRNSQEPQNICHVGGDFYIGYDSANGGGTVYKSNMTTWQKPTADPSSSVEQDYFSTELEWVTNVKQGYTDDNVLCYVVQGGCTDGTYYYAGVIQSTKTVDDVAMIQKFDLATGELVATYHDLKVGHCNDMTYNPNTNEIIVSHALPTEVANKVSIFDAEDFTLKETVELTVGTGAISYDPYENCYVASNLNYVDDVRYATFVKYDLGFNEIGRTQANIGLITQKTTQNLDVDSKYIYYCQYQSNAIIVYDKTTGEHVKDIILPKQTNEAEHVFHVGETLYVGYYNQPGGTLYKVNITAQEQS
ncbi:MAG: hypothetical protein IJX03_00640 [Clostridia bacterium]|nr:hypothetical protein [Clostridia bacterium]